MLLGSANDLLHIHVIAHEGKLVCFGTAADGRVWYSVKQDGYESSYLGTPDAIRTGWENWSELKFPDEDSPDASVAQKEEQELTYKDGPATRYLKRSRYKTGDQAVAAPVQPVSGPGHLYVFRQSRDNTLLVDRFVLDGLTNKLTRKLEVRYKRSRMRHTPAGTPKRGDRWLLDTDALDFRDITGRDFHEPTTELCLVDGLQDGEFAVVLLPTDEQDRYRWHIFAYSSLLKKVQVVSLRMSEDGLFDVLDHTRCEPEVRTLPGVVRRTLDFTKAAFARGLTATRYDLQKEQQTDDGPQLMRESVRVLLAFVTTEDSTAAFSFGVAANGMLAQPTDAPAGEVLRRGVRREVSLPASALDDIRAVALSTVKGTLEELREGKNGEVVVKLAGAGLDTLDRRTIQISDSKNFNQLFSTVTAIDAAGFEVTPSQPGAVLGVWESLPDAQSVAYDGRITAYQKTAGGKLRISAPNHGLTTQDTVQIVDTRDYNGVYTVTKASDGTLTLGGASWQAGTAVSMLRTRGARRRGLVFDGVDDHVKLPTMSPDFTRGVTIEAWVRYDSFKNFSRVIEFGDGKGSNLFLANALTKSTLSLGVAVAGQLSQVEAAGALKLGEWMHVAATIDGKGTARLYVNGQEKASGAIPVPARLVRSANHIGKSNYASDGYFHGQMSDVRVWTRARGADEIRGSMHVELTGDEDGLLGNWKLGGLVQHPSPTTPDASTQGNDGQVLGGPVLAGVKLPRKLASGTDADQYVNEDLVSVTQRGAYSEEFEFKLPVGKDPNKIDGAAKIFALVWSGRRGVGSRDAVRIPAAAGTTFKKLGDDGWHLASATFNVPDGVSVVRMFGLEEVKGDWQELEIRNRRVTYLSERVTEVSYTHSGALAVKADPLASNRADLQAFALTELNLEQLQIDRRVLERRLAELKGDSAAVTTAKQAEIAAKQLQVDALIKERDARKAEYELWNGREVTLYNAWRFIVDPQQGLRARGWKLGSHVLPSDWANTLSSIKIAKGLRVTMFENADFSGRYVTLFEDLGEFTDGWNDLTRSIRVTAADGSLDSLDPLRSRYQEKETALTVAQLELASLKAALADITQEASRKAALTATLTTALATLVADIHSAQATLTAKKAAILADTGAAATGVAMDVLSTVQGLTTQGALLEFIRPIGRLHALETCEGAVQLSYFDGSGCARQTIYNATRDAANTPFERWLPDRLRSGLNFSANDHWMALDAPVELRDDWSVELWFLYPYPYDSSTSDGYLRSFVTGSVALERLVVAACHKNGDERLGMVLCAPQGDGKFIDSGFDMKTLRPGWHHLAVVASGTGAAAETRYYIDGKSPDVRADGRGCAIQRKPSMRVAGIGNGGPSGWQPAGKLAEVRLWGVALSPEEVLASSQTTLTGNEPGLLAYFPMNDRSGARVADRARRGHDASLTSDALWWPCAAPIGNPGNAVLSFDGVDDHVEVPAALNPNFGGGLTFEAWVRYDSFEHYARVLEFAGGPNRGNVYFSNLDRTGTLVLGVVNTSNRSEIKATDALRLNQWMHVAATVDAAGNAKLYVNGQLKSQQVGLVPQQEARTSSYLGRSSWASDGYFHGQMAEVRVWTRARSADEIWAGMLRRVPRDAPGLVACWTGQDLTADGKVRDLVNPANHGTRRGGLVLAASNTLPISAPAIVSAEYATIGVDATTGQRTATMRRCFAAPAPFGVTMTAGKRVEALELRWVGNGQFAPTLLGYIEGPPPIPGENLTVEDNYSGATAVELTTSEDVQYSWRRAQDAGLGASVNAFLGADTEIDLLTAPMGVGTQEKLLKLRAGFKGELGLDYRFQNESSVAASSSNHLTDRIELRGAREQDARFPHLGRRFIPKNVGYALVVSALADVFITRLARTRRMIGYQVLPVEGVPPDINTITFLINPAYTMNGSLDGMTGSGATSQRFFKHVPALRAQYGSLYPASYYRLQEAYELKERIEKEDKRRQAYFNQFNSLLVDEGSLARETDRGDAPAGVAPAPAADPQAADADARAAADAARAAGRSAYDANSAAVERRNAEIAARITDADARAHASACFASWQTRMEDILIRAGKRNIVNTYVWDNDGGLRTEEQSFASTAEHTIGGAFALNAALGGELAINAAGFQLELTSQTTIGLTQTMSKTETRTRGLELRVDLGGVESRGVTDYDDLPLQPGEKVGRYRFMSFYLEGSAENYNDFFGRVVDPEWLASNSEEARALRQALGKANKAWRVLHRVTYVERPALAGFGRDQRAVVGQASNVDVETSILGMYDRLDQLKQQLDEVLKKLDP